MLRSGHKWEPLKKTECARYVNTLMKIMIQRYRESSKGAFDGYPITEAKGVPGD
jgi:hypothetical protein